jgi:hypothetical protein
MQISILGVDIGKNGSVKLTDTRRNVVCGFCLFGLQACDFIPHLYGFGSQFAVVV